MGLNYSTKSLLKVGVAVSGGLLTAHYAYRLIAGTYLINNIISFLVVIWVLLLVLILFTFLNRHT